MTGLSSDRRVRAAAVILVLAAAIAVGYVAGKSGSSSDIAKTQGEDSAQQVWTCSMHPQVRNPGPGKCPICFMDLIPVESGQDSKARTGTLSLSSAARALAGVETLPVARRKIVRSIRLSGKIGFDETRLASITARFPGRIERLFVDYTGMPVRKGDHLVSIYSPDLLTAQRELLQSLDTARELEDSSVESLRRSARSNVEAAREKLRLWGFSSEQIEEIEKQKEPFERLTVYSPISGIVVSRNAVEGTYVQTGTAIYTIADITGVWVNLDAYESDLAWLRYGQEVSFNVESYPGEEFRGRVVFVSPVLDERTRSVKVRINADNTDDRLKPGMFARAEVRATLNADGRAEYVDMSGKWICPMHPEVIADVQESCRVCGMDLVSAQSLGLDAPHKNEQLPLTVPASAVLLTGKRAVVYVRDESISGLFSPRVVMLGPKGDDGYVVKSGLRDGEEVVVKGAFKIDSALQILGKPSMMNPVDDLKQTQPETVSVVSSDTVPEWVSGLMLLYLDIQEALSGDDFAAAQTAVAKLHEASMSVKDTAAAGNIMKAAMKLSGAKTIADARRDFEPLAAVFINIAHSAGNLIDEELSVMRCPMAFGGRGALWLQRGTKVSNPYYGAAMARCGEQKELIPVSAEGSDND